MSKQERLVTVQELCDVLGCAKVTVHKWVAQRRIRNLGVGRGGLTQIPLDDLKTVTPYLSHKHGREITFEEVASVLKIKLLDKSKAGPLEPVGKNTRSTK